VLIASVHLPARDRFEASGGQRAIPGRPDEAQPIATRIDRSSAAASRVACHAS
jgi:hypothetical protein